MTTEKYVIMPNGTLELDTTGVIPANCPVDPVAIEGQQGDSHWLDGMTDLQCEEFLRLPLRQLGRYTKMRWAGESHNIALMLATRSFPGVKTDAVFNEGKFSGESGQIKEQQLWMRQYAESQGVSTNGKWYCSGLSQYPGDPRAWIDSRADVKRLAEENNLTTHGYVEHRGREVEPMADVDIDPSLVHAEAMDIVESMPGAKYEDVYEKVHEIRSGKIDRNPLLVED